MTRRGSQRNRVTHLSVWLNGPAGVGKGTIGNILARDHAFLTYAIAAPIYAAVYADDPALADGRSLVWLVRLLGWEKLKRHERYGPQVRRLLQECGDRLRSKGGQYVLLEMLDQKMAYDLRHLDDQPTAITDLRLPHEAEWARARFGVVWQVTRDGVSAANGHRTEQQLPARLVDFVVVNDDTVDRLALVLDHYVDQSRDLVRERAAASVPSPLRERSA